MAEHGTLVVWYVNCGNINHVTLIFQKRPYLWTTDIHEHHISPLLNSKLQTKIIMMNLHEICI